MAKKDENTNAVPARIVIDTETDNQGTQDNSEALEQISSRMEAIETRITEGLEGERTWTTQTITSLQNELQSLKDQVQSLTTENQSLTTAQKALRDELILQLQEARAKLEAPPEPPQPPQELPPNKPPNNQALPLKEDVEGPQVQPSSEKKAGKRVI